MAPKPRTSPTSSHCDCHSLARSAEAFTENIRASIEIFLLDDVEHSQRRRARRRIATERAAKLARRRGVHNFGAAGDRCHRQPAGKRLRHRDEIGLKPETLAGEQSAGPRETGLHFIGDNENVVFAANLGEDREEFCGRGHESAFSKDRLDDHSGNGFRGNDAFEGVFEVARTVHFARGVSF